MNESEITQEINRLRQEIDHFRGLCVSLRAKLDEMADDVEDPVELDIRAGGGVDIKQSGNVVVISAAKDKSPMPCKITSGNSLDGYQVEIYGNGVGKSLTGYGVLMILEISATSNLPVGSWVLGFPGGTVVTGGTE